MQLFDITKAQGQPCFCPTTMMEVDAEIMIPNVGLQKEALRFLKDHPWAFEFDPRQKIKSIRVWD